MYKKALFSKTIQFFSSVAVAGGIDIVISLLNQEVIDWRSVVIAAIGIAGIALRLKTKEPVVF